MGILIVWFFVGLPDSPAMLWLKTRITYPRTGFVVLPQADASRTLERGRKSKVLKWVAGGMLVASWLFAISEPNTWIGTAALTAGVGAFCLANRDDERFSVAWLLIPSLWMGAWLAKIFPVGHGREGPYVWLAFGALLFIAGVARLLRFLWQHRASGE
jgi:hypothetical protein